MSCLWTQQFSAGPTCSLLTHVGIAAGSVSPETEVKEVTHANDIHQIERQEDNRACGVAGPAWYYSLNLVMCLSHLKSPSLDVWHQKFLCEINMAKWELLASFHESVFVCGTEHNFVTMTRACKPTVLQGIGARACCVCGVCVTNSKENAKSIRHRFTCKNFARWLHTEPTAGRTHNVLQAMSTVPHWAIQCCCTSGTHLLPASRILQLVPWCLRSLGTGKNRTCPIRIAWRGVRHGPFYCLQFDFVNSGILHQVCPVFSVHTREIIWHGQSHLPGHLTQKLNDKHTLHA